MPLALFDLDNTLCDRTTAFERAAHALAEDLGLDPAVAVPAMVAADGDGYATPIEWLAEIRSRFGVAVPLDELLARHRRNYLEVYAVDPATVAALQRLRGAGWRVGIVTNGPPAQEEKIRATGLDAEVDGWAISAVAGARKPDPAVFDAAARACGADLSGAWMVGDSAPADIAGARNAGLRAVWLHRGRSWADVAFVPEHHVVRAGTVPPALPLDFAPDHVVDDIPAAVELMLSGG